MSEKKLQQDAFIWFKNQYGTAPQEIGYKVSVPKTKRFLWFAELKQMVFAPNAETAHAFVKGQTILEKLVSYTMLAMCLIAGLFCFVLFSIATSRERLTVILVSITIGIALLMLIINAVCYFKVKPLEKMYKGRIITYTA